MQAQLTSKNPLRPVLKRIFVIIFIIFIFSLTPTLQIEHSYVVNNIFHSCISEL